MLLRSWVELKRERFSANRGAHLINFKGGLDPSGTDY